MSGQYLRNEKEGVGLVEDTFFKGDWERGDLKSPEEFLGDGGLFSAWL